MHIDFKTIRTIDGKAGFKTFVPIPLTGPTSAAIAYK